jgi:putative heme-binding domain-containing protein
MRFFALFAPSRLIFLLGFVTAVARAAEPVNENAASAKGIDVAMLRLHAPLRDTAPLSPADEQAKFKLRDGLAVDLIAAEPKIRQPLNLTFDERGRMWVVQYIQYPIPAGLKVVEYDQYLRAKFDKVPEPPPKGVKGADVISILEDTDGDGTFDKQKTFVDGLNLCTSVLPGNGGVWVLNPPYLLFYPDKDRDDVPDGDPVVHLSGFGLEDTHAIANSLTWGPDGWIYGAHGSTCTSKVRVEIQNPQSKIQNPTTDFLGQCIWRYHPTRHVFEIFAEGGGNTFGVEFDDYGNCFSGTNWGNFRGMHYVQGGYYIKGWGKHGPLTNPYAFGFFDHMPHQGNADRLTHTFVVYGGGLLPAEFNGKILGANPLMSWISVSRLVPTGSTFKTVEESPLLTSDDGWFRPVDIKTGPDGALYVADFYEQRISHVDPRENWHRENGRIWRIRPKEWKPAGKPFIDMAKLPSGGLVDWLHSPNRSARATARRILAERQDGSAARAVEEYWQTFVSRHGATSERDVIEMLWATNAAGSLGETQVWRAREESPSAAAWGVRLITDAEPRGKSTLSWLSNIAKTATTPSLRAQVASSAKRLPGDAGVELIAALLNIGPPANTDLRPADEADPFIPMLLWWAVEAHASSSRDQITSLFSDQRMWDQAVARKTIYPRLARRYASDESAENYAALVKLLDAAPGDAERGVLLGGVKEAYAGRKPSKLPEEFARRLAASNDPELGVYAGDASALRIATKWARLDDPQASRTDHATRLRLIALLGQLQPPGTVDTLLDIATHSTDTAARSAALAALANVDDPALGQKLADLLPTLAKDTATSAAAVKVLCGRADWSAALLSAVEKKSIEKTIVPAEQLERLRGLDDAKLTAAVERIYGKPVKATSEQARAEIERVAALVLAGPAGDGAAGKKLFDARCARCHTLFGQGAKIGPDLTPYPRQDIRDMAFHIVDPSGFVREEYAQFAVRTKAGQTYVGVVTAREAGAIELTDTSGQRTRIAKADIQLERALPTSAMPTGLLSDLSDAQLRDFFAHLSQPEPRAGKKKN